MVLKTELIAEKNSEMFKGRIFSESTIEKMKQNIVKELSTKELITKLSEEETMYRKMRLNHAVSPIENPMSENFAGAIISERCAISEIVAPERRSPKTGVVSSFNNEEPTLWISVADLSCT